MTTPDQEGSYHLMFYLRQEVVSGVPRALLSRGCLGNVSQGRLGLVYDGLLAAVLALRGGGPAGQRGRHSGLKRGVLFPTSLP